MVEVEYICDIRISSKKQIYLSDGVLNELNARVGDTLMFYKDGDGQICLMVEKENERKQSMLKKIIGEKNKK